jgi:hypothetical protein
MSFTYSKPLKKAWTAYWSPVDWKAIAITWKVISTPGGESNMRRSYWSRSASKAVASR